MITTSLSRIARDRVFPLVAAAVTLTVYLLTMYPGLISLGDAAKFAFVGKVLGTPHAPGYPLYVMVSHLFSYVPLGTLAFRMNVLSAVLASVAVVLCYFAARALGARSWIALAVAVAFGFGQAFWSKALYPKGYTLNAALVCAGIVMLLRWSRSRRRVHLYWAIGIFALSVGNHLIIVALVPALILYVLLTDYRQGLAPRTIGVAVLLAILGFSQYSLILIRTVQQAPYLEARATNVRELVDVVTARRWSHEIGAFTWQDVIQRRVPVVVGLVGRELTPYGLVFSLVGFVVLWRRGRADALLLLVGAAGVIGLTSNMSSNEDEGFLLPAFFLLWLLAAVGFERLVDLVDQRGWSTSPRRTRLIVTGVALLFVALLPARLLARNYRLNDHHRRTFEIRYFDALFGMLPDRSAIVEDRYPINMMLNYKLLGEKAAGSRDIRIVAQRPEQVASHRREGYEIFAFDEGREVLSQFGYEFQPVPLFDKPLPEYLGFVPPGSVIAIAAVPRAADLLRADAAAWTRLGARPAETVRSAGVPLGLVGVAEASGSALQGGATSVVDLSVNAGDPIGSTTVRAPAHIRVVASPVEAIIIVDGAEKAKTTAGAVAVIITPTGGVEAHVLDPTRGLRVPFDARLQPLYRVSASSTCMDVGNRGWQDISHLAVSGRLAARIDNYRPYLSRTLLYVGTREQPRPNVTEVSGTGTSQMTVRSFQPGIPASGAELSRSLDEDDVPETGKLRAYPFVSRIEILVDDKGNHKALDLTFGTAVTMVLVRSQVDLNNPKRSTICGRDTFD